MSVKFLAQNHIYESTTSDKIDWISVTSFIGAFKEPFDSQGIAERSSKKKGSKWYGMTPEEIQAAWKSEAKRSTDLGTWYHNQRENDLTCLSTLELNGFVLPVIKPIEVDGIKYAPDQKLSDGVYPEHFVYLKSAGVCGQSDLVEVVNGFVNITDYKTNKEIKTEGFKSWDGKVKKMLAPLSYLDDCNLNHYTLQLSMYMYIILKHNPTLKPGFIRLHHVLFETVNHDRFDNPIYEVDHQGNFVVKAVVPYDLKYMRKECIDLINYLKDNRDKVKQKKFN